MLNEETLYSLENDPQYSVYAFSWELAFFTFFITSGLIAILVTVILEQEKAEHEREAMQFWWQYLLAGLMGVFDIYCLMQCKVEIVHLDRKQGLLTMKRRGLALYKNYTTSVKIMDIVEMHIEETRKTRGEGPSDYTCVFKVCALLQNGKTLVTLSSRKKAKAQSDLNLILRFVQSCNRSRRRREQQQNPVAVSVPVPLQKGGTASLIELESRAQSEVNFDMPDSHIMEMSATERFVEKKSEMI